MTSFSEATEEERLEALSKHYVDAARVCQVASGRYVVFSMARGEIIAVASTTEELAAGVLAAIARSAAHWETARSEEQEQQRRWGELPEATVAASIGELGL